MLYDNAFLLNDARERVVQLMQELDRSISRANLSELVEDFAVYHFEEFNGTVEVSALLEQHPSEFARLLRAESGELGNEEVQDAVSSRTSYGVDDCAVIDWNGALFFGRDVEDVKAVLEFCNVELLEMRFLDEQLDDYLESAYHVLTTRKGVRPILTGWRACRLTRRSCMRLLRTPLSYWGISTWRAFTHGLPAGSTFRTGTLASGASSTPLTASIISSLTVPHSADRRCSNGS